MKRSNLPTCATGCGHIEVCHLIGDAYASEIKRLGNPICHAPGIVPRPFGHPFVLPVTPAQAEASYQANRPHRTRRVK